MKSLKDLFIVFLLLAFEFQINAGTDEKQWLYQIILDSGEGIIELPDTTDPCIYFLLFGNHSFEPDSLILERKEQGHWEKIGDKNSILIGKSLPIDLFQELKAVPWSVPPGIYEKGVSSSFR